MQMAQSDKRRIQLQVFYRRPEFNSLVAYQLMFWTGIMDVGQLIVFDVSGVVAAFQWNRFPSYFLGSTLYALWFSMLFLSIFTTLNRFVSVVFRSHYNTLFNKNHVKVSFTDHLASFGYPKETYHIISRGTHSQQFLYLIPLKQSNSSLLTLNKNGSWSNRRRFASTLMSTNVYMNQVVTYHVITFLVYHVSGK
ncbi:unnamed protein product [Haemonchus placei]|uniref:7TM_GPCR_Srx domain-containing protein n=1 Tax=Haemonchus placei TaxID=6290 RepID=A0A0N4W4D5_HAEPC|nr:unnamed protein product [Haemonchus placei]